MKQLFLSCEHASNAIPKKYNDEFKPFNNVLNTHKGFDMGAYDIFRALKCMSQLPSFYGKWSRLLIDLNRSLSNRNCFSSIFRSLSQHDRQAIISEYYNVYYQHINTVIQNEVNKKHNIIHIAVHSFVPSMNNVVRDADIGVLFDSGREREAECGRHWKKLIQHFDPKLKVKLNYPYKGISDGLCTSIRKKYSQSNYIGIELEINQKNLISNIYKTHITAIIKQSLYNLLKKN